MNSVIYCVLPVSASVPLTVFCCIPHSKYYQAVVYHGTSAALHGHGESIALNNDMNLRRVLTYDIDPSFSYAANRSEKFCRIAS